MHIQLLNSIVCVCVCVLVRVHAHLLVCIGACMYTLQTHTTDILLTISHILKCIFIVSTSKVSRVFSNRFLPPSYGGEPREMAIVSVVLGALSLTHQ